MELPACGISADGFASLKIANGYRSGITTNEKASSVASRLDQPHQPNASRKPLDDPIRSEVKNLQFTANGQHPKANSWLTKLCLYMARPIDKRIDPKDAETYMGDRREKFNTAVIEQRWPLFREIDPADRFGCLWFFLGCKAYIHQKYKGKLWFDTHDEEGNEIIGVQKDDKPQPFRWIEICRKLAGGKFGNLRETQFAGLYEVLEELVGQRGS